MRAGPARAVGKLRDTDGMVTDRSDDDDDAAAVAAAAAAAAATDQLAALSLIQAGDKLPNVAKP